MCVLSIKVSIWKKSGNLFNDPRTCQIKDSVNLSFNMHMHTHTHTHTHTHRYICCDTEKKRHGEHKKGW